MKQTPAHNDINFDLLNLIPANSKRIVEVGCMNGQMARAYLPNHPGVCYTGIDIDEDYVKEASKYCSHVLLADIEEILDRHFDELFPSDCWIFGDCLEHLRDPWSILRKIRAKIDHDGCLLACIPNAQHWSVQWRLQSGQFFYEESGLMDKTHIRWFTRITMLEMFKITGWEVSHFVSRIPAKIDIQMKILEGIEKFALASNLDAQLAVQDALPIQYVFKLKPN